MPGHRRLDTPAPSPSLTDHARAWNPPGDPVAELDRAISEARTFGRRLPRETDDGEVPDKREAVADEADRRNGERERDVWNASYPIGQAVLAFGPGETCYRGRTTSVACLPAGNIPAVEVIVPGRPPGFWPLSYLQPVAELSDAVAAAAESERPGVLPVAPAAPGSRTGPDALAVLCHELGLELLALAEARRDGKSWDDGHWKRLRGAIEAAGAVVETKS
jgi:hypothetical protein